MDIFSLLIPRNQNNIQRIGFASALIGMVLVVFLHNPLDGYNTEETRNWTEEIRSPECTSQEFSDILRLGSQAVWPLADWSNQHIHVDPLPEGIQDWPFRKQFEWRQRFRDRANALRAKCITLSPRSSTETIPFSEWRSENPSSYWLASVVHLLGAIFSIALGGVIWLFVFQTKHDGTRQS